MEATAATLERRVRVIPATRKPEELHRNHDGKMRVAAYCRVSTDSEEQLNSYEAQKTYYTQKIHDRSGHIRQNELRSIPDIGIVRRKLPGTLFADRVDTVDNIVQKTSFMFHTFCLNQII